MNSRFKGSLIKMYLFVIYCDNDMDWTAATERKTPDRFIWNAQGVR